MTEKVTRRDVATSGMGVLLTSVVATIADWLLHEDMVPLSELGKSQEKCLADLDKARLEHVKDLRFESDRRVRELRECMTESRKACE